MAAVLKNNENELVGTDLKWLSPAIKITWKMRKGKHIFGQVRRKTRPLRADQSGLRARSGKRASGEFRRSLFPRNASNFYVTVESDQRRGVRNVSPGNNPFTSFSTRQVEYAPFYLPLLSRDRSALF